MMRRLVVVLITTASVAARAEPQEADTVTRGELLIPALQLSASTDNTSKLKASVPYVLPAPTEGTVIIAAPRLQIASTSGVSTLFSSSSTETLPWEAGLSLLVVQPPSAGAKNVLANQMKIRAYDVCAAECTDDATCKFKSNDPAVKVKFKKSDLCPDGHAQFLREESALSGLRSIPEARLSAGWAVGRQQFKYLTGPFGAGDTLGTGSTIETTTRGGASYMRAWPLQGTHAGIFEARGLYTRGFSAASGTGHWCQPEGMVGTDPNSAVQQCKDLALGPPSESSSFTLAADVGVVDSFAQTWRASLGAFDTTGIAGVPDAFGIEVPVYLNLSGLADYPAGNYKGILRITPRLSWSRSSSGHFPTTVVLTIEALGQDSLFAEVLDY